MNARLKIHSRSLLLLLSFFLAPRTCTKTWTNRGVNKNWIMHFWQRAAAAPDAQCSLTHSQEHLSNERTMDIDSGSSWNQACLFFEQKLSFIQPLFIQWERFPLLLHVCLLCECVLCCPRSHTFFFFFFSRFVCFLFFVAWERCLFRFQSWLIRNSCSDWCNNFSLWNNVATDGFLFLINTGKMPPFHYFCGESVIFIYMPPPSLSTAGHTEKQ